MDGTVIPSCFRVHMVSEFGVCMRRRAFQGGASYGHGRSVCWEDPHESSISRAGGRD